MDYSFQAGGKQWHLVRLQTAEDARAMTDWTDLGMNGDYFIRRGHMKGLIENPKSKVFAVCDADMTIVGFVVVYDNSVLHNLHLAPEVRGHGLGSVIIATLQPEIVRCKRDMVAGDPIGFYERQGYQAVGNDPVRNNITVMAQPELVAAEEKRLAKKAAAAARAKAYRLRRQQEAELQRAASLQGGPTPTLGVAGPVPSTNGQVALQAPVALPGVPPQGGVTVPAQLGSFPATQGHHG